MQLDRTHVTIRARTITEIGDLALILIRQYPGAWVTGLALGAAPWVLLNLLLLGWMPIADSIDGIVDEQTIAQRQRYTGLMCSLVFLQAPLAGTLTTYYIGQAVFEHRPPWRDVLRAYRQTFWRCLWVLGVVRGPLIAMALLATNWGGELAPIREIFWMDVILLLALGLRAFRPFLPEILMLERCPLRQREDVTITARRRSSLLHSPLSAELFGRFLLTGLVYVFLVGGVFYSLLFVRSIATGQWSWSLQVGGIDIPDVQLVIMPLALWLVVGLSIFVRFLCYLDARIRLEGWEVELAVRAEALRQFGSELPENMRSQARGRAAVRSAETEHPEEVAS